MLSPARTAIADGREALVKAQTELTTGRHADVGRELGTGIAEVLRLRDGVTEADSRIANLGLVRSRFDVGQTALGEVSDYAQAFLAELIGAGSAVDRRSLVQGAKAALDGVVASLSTSFKGAYLFSGIEVQSPPFQGDLSSPTSGGRSAVAAAFAAEFGFASDDPAVASIDASDLRAFLNGNFDALFQAPSWEASFSNAGPAQGPVALTDVHRVALDATANDPAVRSLISTLVAVIDLGTERLDGEAFAMLIEEARSRVGGAISGVDQLRATAGRSQAMIGEADDW